jgi:hypothetical protein
MGLARTCVLHRHPCTRLHLSKANTVHPLQRYSAQLHTRRLLSSSSTHRSTPEPIRRTLQGLIHRHSIRRTRLPSLHTGMALTAHLQPQYCRHPTRLPLTPLLRIHPTLAMAATHSRNHHSNQ